MFIGLMGIGGYGELYSPKGRYLMRTPFGNSRHYPRLCRISLGLSRKIQASQHWIARKTWRV